MRAAAARRCGGGFAAVGPAAMRYPSLAARPAGRRPAAAAPQQQMPLRCQLT